MLSDRQLTPLQEKALVHLSAGLTPTAAAKIAGVHRNTIHNWLRSSVFADALRQYQHDRVLAWRGEAQSLDSLALGAIQTILSDPNVPADVRLQAALSIRGQPAPAPPTPATPAARTGRNDPCRCGSGRKFKRCCIDKLSA